MEDLLEAAKLSAPNKVDSFLDVVRTARQGTPSGVPVPPSFPILSGTQWEQLKVWLDHRCSDRLPPFGKNDGLEIYAAQARRQVAEWILGERPKLDEKSP